MIRAGRSHEICAGHRIFGHEGKCAHLHGHAYVFDFVVAAEPEQPALDTLGRVIDFAIIKSTLCQWLEKNWDHRMLLWENDPILHSLRKLDPDGIVALPLNPTAENLARIMVESVGPMVLRGTGVHLVECTVHETGKCWAVAS